MTSPKKPILDVLRGLLQHRTDDAGCYEFVLECWIEEAANEIERLQPRWISVGERLPVIKDRVLVRVDGWTTIAYRINASSVYNAWVGPDGHGLWPPTHWMPLPEPPEVK